jgi:PGF-CTERM protein
MRNALAITLALLVFAGGLAPVVTADAGPTTDAASTVESAAATHDPGATGVDLEARRTDEEDDSEDDEAPPDPEDDVLGWEEVNGHGVWHNETLEVDNSDGLDQTELDKLVARSMARAEIIRELEFENTTPVDIRSREQYRKNISEAYSNFSNRDSVHQNVKYEATFLVPEDENAIDVLEDNRAGSVAGYYSPTEDQIVIVSDSPESLEMDEFTLVHELVHALQDQHFNLTRPELNGKTEDENNAANGIVEGDANYVEERFRQRCNDPDHAYNGSCVRPTSGGAGGGDIHVGILVISFQPYSDGPVLVDRIYQEGGWDAVNEVYDDPPASSEQVVHPEKYPDEKPADLEYEDRSNEDWEVLVLEGNDSVNYATFGEGGLFAMVWYPSYTERSDQVVPYNHLFDVPPGSYATYNYDFWITDGWNGDELYPYVPTDQEEYDYEETGYVWKLKWDTERDAKQFVRGYDSLLKFYDAEEVEDRQNTYVIDDSEQFGDAYYVQREGQTVWIVNAPSVEELPAIREGAAPEATETTTTEDDGTTTDDDGTTTDDGGDGTTDGETTTDSDGDDGTDQETPGFGLTVAGVALLVGALLAARRYRR